MAEPFSAAASGGPGEIGKAPVASQRAHPRFPLTLRGQARVSGVSDMGRIEVVSSNISLLGIALHSNHPGVFREDDVIEVVFPSLPAGTPVTIHVRIVWVREGLAPHLGKVSFGGLFYGTRMDAVVSLLESGRETAALQDSAETF